MQFCEKLHRVTLILIRLWKNGGHRTHFLSYKLLKLILRVLLTVYPVAMITFYAIKITIIGSSLAWDLRDTNIVLSLDKQR